MIKKKYIFAGCIIGFIALWVGTYYFFKKTDFSGLPASKYNLGLFRKTTSKKQSSAIIPDNQNVSFIIQADSISSAGRLRQAHQLGNNLSENDRLAIAEYLKHGPNNDIEYVIKNDLMNKLRNQKEIPPELTELLIGLANDRKQDIVVRSYALQHLRPQYEQTKDEAIKEIFYSALDEHQSEMAGVALLALRYLVTEYPNEFDRQLIATKVLDIVKDKDTYVLTKISAIQVAASLKIPEAEETIRLFASDVKQPFALRLAAIAGLGDMGTTADLTMLSEIQASKGPLSKAAMAAIRKIKNKY